MSWNRRRLALAEERDRALAALKELEFDHRTGKVSDDDYRAARRTVEASRGGNVACTRPAGATAYAHG